ncbi:MAG: hypothetical protein FJ100_18850 [Deltaproteobacteria bacterium]|nr:hypothetical protein [Deltaproteobacteria bacterium]
MNRLDSTAARRRTALVASFLALSELCALQACNTTWDPAGPRPEGLGTTPAGGGPKVVWDPEHKPLPEIPLPNNAATRLDPTTATGRRVHISLDAARTGYERRTRTLFNKLDGFGAFGPISVRFDAPLDLPNLVTRHNGNDDFRDDAVFLFNVDPKCSRYGEEVALDLGRGRFPITLMNHSRRSPDPKAPGGYLLDEGDNRLFPFDPHGETMSVLASHWNEDSNGNGKLDAGEDLDGDGVLDVANFVDPKACDGKQPGTVAYDQCVADNLIGWYERETHTLIVRPVWPLQERCTYAVVLTDRLRGADGQPVRSPLPAVSPRDQMQDLTPVASLLPRYGLTKKNVAFAWTYTVGTMTEDLLAVRDGLYGKGKFARLATEFPVSGFKVWTRNEWRKRGGDSELTEEQGGKSLALQGGCATSAVTTIAGTGDGDLQICGGYADFASSGAIFAGTFRAPNFLVDKDGDATERYPADEDEAFAVDAHNGTATYGGTDVHFWCSLPRADQKPASVQCKPGNPDGQPWCKPYPVVFYTHGYGSFKGEFLLHVGRHAQMGVAGCALDSFGHGRSSVLDPQCPGALELALGKSKLAKYGYPELLTMVFAGRDRDLNNDGCGDGGADQWTANLFHTRDVVRQSVLEEIQLVRMLRAMDGKHKDQQGHILGDVDGDGQPDLGGPNSRVSAWGISLGGQLTAVLAGAEPTMNAVSPNAVGAGLTDISLRLGQGGLAEAVMLPVQGPILVGCLPVDGHQRPLQSGEGGKSCLPDVGDQPGVAGKQPAGELQLAWYAHDNAKHRVRAIARVGGVQPGDRVEIVNLDKDLRVQVAVNPRGWFRGHIAADALWPIHRRKVLGLKDGDRDPVAFADTPRLGDRIEVRVYEGATDKRRHTVNQWQWDTTFQGTTYPNGKPLVAMQEGLGYPRNTPDFRRFYGIAAHAIAPADPASWAERYFQRPHGDDHRNHVLVMPTVGDSQVPAATGVSLGRTAGLLGSWRRDPDKYKPEHGWRELFTPDPRYGVSIEEWLRKHWVIEGDARLQRWASYAYNPHVLFDPDNVSDGAARFVCAPEAPHEWSKGEFLCPNVALGTPSFGVPHPPKGQELRIARLRGDGSADAFRMPMLRPAGQHGIYNPQPFRTFDADAYMVNFTARFMASNGTQFAHVQGCDCSYRSRAGFTFNGKPDGPGLDDVSTCDDTDTAYGKVCSPVCADTWGLYSPPLTQCSASP